ncbi:MAG: hypothetical protein ABI650_08775, partial [Dokdonella sp.]
DSQAGLDAARAAGIATLVTVNDYTRTQEFAGALSVLSDLGELADPAQHLGGMPLQRGWVDIAQLQHWHASTNEPADR